MRVAKDFYEGYEPHSLYPNYYHELQIEEMIKTAQIEAIKECAEVACDTAEAERCVDKQAILKLLNEVK